MSSIFLSSAPAAVLDSDTGITIREGFDAELLYEVPASQGSWVSMAFDPKGRLIVSDQDDKGVFRVTLPGNGSPIKVESLPGFPYEPIDWGKRNVGGALGFLYAFDSLYMVTMKGLYRVRDTDGDDTFDEFKLLKRLNYGYEHSAHSIIPICAPAISRTEKRYSQPDCASPAIASEAKADTPAPTSARWAVVLPSATSSSPSSSPAHPSPSNTWPAS